MTGGPAPQAGRPARLHLVDGTFELYRAHFGKQPGHVDPQGRDRKATVGIVSSLLALLADPAEQVTHLAVAFDNPIRSFRNALYPYYKSDEGVPPELRAQFDAAEEAVAALGVTVWSMDRWEADDALGTAALRYADQVDQVRIMTPDKDLGQVVRGQRVVQVDRIRGKLIDEAAVVDKHGVGPASIPDLLGLVGDPADGIPGLPGWGAKSAATVLARWGHLDAIPADPAAWEVKVRGAEGLAATLEAQRAAATLYVRLATLATDVPLAEDLDALRWRGAPAQRWQAWCEAVRAPRRLRERPAQVPIPPAP